MIIPLACCLPSDAGLNSMKRNQRKELAQISWRLKGQLYGVLSTTEVCDGWHIHYTTVINAIRQGNVVARKAGRFWMISYRSAVKYWGKPIEIRVHQDEE